MKKEWAIRLLEIKREIDAMIIKKGINSVEVRNGLSFLFGYIESADQFEETE